MSANLPMSDSATGDLCAGYEPLDGVYDELMTPELSVRPHWRALIAALESIPASDLAKRWRLAERLRHENGLTYTIDSDADLTTRPWDLDFVPLVLDPATWQTLDRGLAQRARLLNAILADLYGPQRLLRDGDLPAVLLFATPTISALVGGSLLATGSTCTTPPPTSAAAPTGAGGSWPTGRSRRPASAMRSRTGSCWPAACRSCFAITTSSGSPATSRLGITAWSPERRGRARASRW